MRRALLLLTTSAALVVVGPAAARLVPIRHSGPRAREGTLPLSRGATRIRVIAKLSLPPLSTRADRVLSSAARHKLNVASVSSRAYLHLLGVQQAKAAAAIRSLII